MTDRSSPASVHPGLPVPASRPTVGQKAEGPLAVHLHDLQDAIPVGFVEGEAAGSSSWFEAHYTEACEGGEALCAHCYMVLPRIQ